MRSEVVKDEEWVVTKNDFVLLCVAMTVYSPSRCNFP
jgi:hypothetical protein